MVTAKPPDLVLRRGLLCLTTCIIAGENWITSFQSVSNVNLMSFYLRGQDIIIKKTTCYISEWQDPCQNSLHHWMLLSSELQWDDWHFFLAMPLFWGTAVSFLADSWHYQDVSVELRLACVSAPKARSSWIAELQIITEQTLSCALTLTPRVILISWKMKNQIKDENDAMVSGGEMRIKWCTGHLHRFHLTEWSSHGKRTNQMNSRNSLGEKTPQLVELGAGDAAVRYSVGKMIFSNC